MTGVAIPGCLLGALALAILAWGGSPWSALLLIAANAALTWELWRLYRPHDGAGGARAALLAFCFPALGSLWPLLASFEPGVVPPVGETAASVGEPPAWDDPEGALRDELSVTPLVDDLRLGSLEAKRHAAEAIADLEQAEGVELLRSLLVAPNGDTRLFASLGMLRLEERLLTRLKGARLACELRPLEAASHLQRAEAGRRYAASGLLGVTAAMDIWAEVLDAACTTLEARPSEDQVVGAWHHRALAHLALGAPEAAWQALQPALTLARRSPELLRLACEIRFALGDFEALHPLAPALLEVARPASNDGQIAQHWRTHER